MTNLNVKVSKVQRNGEERWTGTIGFPGIRSTKLVRQSDDSAEFSTRSAVISAAKNLAKKLNVSLVLDEPTVRTATRTAAKKSIRV